MTDDRRLPKHETGRPGIPNYFCVTAYCAGFAIRARFLVKYRIIL